MIAELVKHYDTLKRCDVRVPDPYFAELPVSVQITLAADGSLRNVEWICKPKDEDARKRNPKSAKEEPVADMDCPVTERSSCRSSGNDAPHGLVDNVSWIFGQLAPEESAKREPATPARRKAKAGQEKASAAEQRREAYRRQLSEFHEKAKEHMPEVKTILDALAKENARSQIWVAVELLLKSRIKADDLDKWRARASKVNIRWVVETTGFRGCPVHALEHVKRGWVQFQRSQDRPEIISLIDGERKQARLLHPRIKGGSLVSFNDSATYCGHLHASLSKTTKERPNMGSVLRKSKEEDSGDDGSALPAQVGFEEAEKYAAAFEWLVANSSVRFGNTTNCLWVDQAGDGTRKLDKSVYDLVVPQGRKSAFSRAKAKKGKGQTLADSGDLIESLRRFRNAQSASYRHKEFYLMSVLLRNKGRHAVLGAFQGTMGELEDNVDLFLKCSTVHMPKNYLLFNDAARDFCPTLMDILDTAGVISQRKKRLVWDREVVEVIVRGRHLPPDLCRLVVLKAIQQKYQEQSKETRGLYREILAIAAGCARHYLTRISRKENYGMGLDTTIRESAYLAGRLFAVCERIQKRGRDWGSTLSDKLFSAGIERPRSTLGQLYRNCLCYEMYKKDREWFAEIFDKIRLEEGTEPNSSVMPAQGLDAFEFLLGYWHQRSAIQDAIDAQTDNQTQDEEQKEDEDE